LVINKTKLQINNFKFSIFNSNKVIWLYLYNNNYSIFLKLNNVNKVKIISSITILLKKYSYSNHINIFLQKYTNQLYFYEYVKIKFSGKGYKIKKNNEKSMLLLFNRAHITQTWWKNIILKKLKKYKIYIKYTYKNNNFIKSIINIRYINIFTKKGLRKSKQILFKKKGKK
jgi:hypothetical protein